MSTITIIGTGYVGLVTGACLAEVGNHVLCLDVDKKKIDVLNAGRVPIHEPGLAEMIRRNAEAGRIAFTTDIDAAVNHGVLQFIAVGTPPEEDGSADLRHVIEAARNIGRRMNDWRIVVNKSTVPVGTADHVCAVIEEELGRRGADVSFAVASNPEFLKEGAAIDDFMRPDRVVIGTNDERVIKVLRNLYAPFMRNHDRLLFMDIRSAELTKYAANAMLATRISFMNELANLSDRIGADIEAVRVGIGSDKRIGTDFLYAGIGYGGSCFPKDVRALLSTARQFGTSLKVVEAVERANSEQRYVMVNKIVEHFGPDLRGMTFAVWGLAFKSNTDDMREAPSREIILALVQRGAAVAAYDPVATEQARVALTDTERITFATSAADALCGADALLVLTEWKEFRSPDFARIATLLRRATLFDGRNLYNPETVKATGMVYVGIGRGR